MAVVINTVGTEYFTINGVRYARIFQPLTTEIGKVGIYNAYDTRQQLLPQTPFYELTIDAVVPTSVTEAAELLLPVIWAYNGSGGGIGTLDWGNITGLLSNQTDLVAEFATKSDTGHTHLHTDITDFDTELAGTSNITAFTPTLDYHPATKKYVFDEDEIQREILSTGISDGGEISINVDTTKFDIAAGTGFVVDHTVHPSVVTKVEWSAFTAQSVTDIATQSATDLAIDEGGSIVQQLSFTEEEKRSLIFLGGLSHLDNINIDRTFPLNVMSDGIGSNLYELSQAIGDINTSGNVFFPNVGGNLSIDKTAGTTFSYGRNNTINKNAPNALSQGSQTICNILRVFDDGTGNGSFSLATTVDPTKYDDGSGTLVTLTGGKWSIQRVLMFSNSGQVVVQYGNDQYVNKADAITNATLTSFASLAGFKTAIVRGYIIMKNTVTDLTTSDAEFVVADRFGGVSSRDSGSTGSVAWGSITGTLSAQTDLQAALDLKADLSGDIFTGDISVPTEVYGIGWSASAEVPTKGDLYTKIETLGGGGSIGGTIAATQLAYGSGVDTIAGSANLTWDGADLAVSSNNVHHDGNVGKHEHWEIYGNSGSTGDQWVHVADILGGQADRYKISITGASGYSSGTGNDDGTVGGVDLYITVGNNVAPDTDNLMVSAYRHSVKNIEAVIEQVKTVKVAALEYEIWIKCATFAGFAGQIYSTTGGTWVTYSGTTSATEPAGTIAKPIHDYFHTGQTTLTTADNADPLAWTLQSQQGVSLLLYADTGNNVGTEGYNPTIEWRQDGGLVETIIGLEGVAGTAFSGSVSNYMYAISSHGFQWAVGTTEEMTLNTTGLVVNDDVTAASFIPAGGDSSLSMQEWANDPTVMSVTNTNGYFAFGMANTSFAHFRTDATVGFYFDSTLIIDGANEVRGYDNDLLLTRGGSATARLQIADGVTYSHQDMEIDNFLLKNSTDRAGLLEIAYNTNASWHGIQIKDDAGQLWSVMGNATNFGLFNDTAGEWILYSSANSWTRLYYNGAAKLETTSGGITVTGDGTATDWNATSDERLKHDIKPLGEYPITTNWVSYKWNDTDREDIGLIAQDLEKTNPEFVKHDDEGIKSISYTKVLVAKMAEKDRQIEDLTNRLTKIEKMLCQ